MFHFILLKETWATWESLRFLEASRREVVLVVEADLADAPDGGICVRLRRRAPNSVAELSNS